MVKDNYNQVILVSYLNFQIPQYQTFSRTPLKKSVALFVAKLIQIELNIRLIYLTLSSSPAKAERLRW
jgi:hypothetical protein